MAKIRTPNLSEQITSLGDFIASQRRSAELSLRQLADQTGISNPYLSQIERGLRKPSAEVLQQLSKALRVSAETLYVRAGMLDPRDHAATTVQMAILADPALTERQRQVLIDVYSSFVKENVSPDAPMSGTPEGLGPLVEGEVADPVAGASEEVLPEDEVLQGDEVLPETAVLAQDAVVPEPVVVAEPVVTDPIPTSAIPTDPIPTGPIPVDPVVPLEALPAEPTPAEDRNGE